MRCRGRAVRAQPAPQQACARHQDGVARVGLPWPETKKLYRGLKKEHITKIKQEDISCKCCKKYSQPSKIWPVAVSVSSVSRPAMRRLIKLSTNCSSERLVPSSSLADTRSKSCLHLCHLNGHGMQHISHEYQELIKRSREFLTTMRLIKIL